jgi:hypothetical protein
MVYDVRLESSQFVTFVTLLQSVAVDINSSNIAFGLDTQESEAAIILTTNQAIEDYVGFIDPEIEQFNLLAALILASSATWRVHSFGVPEEISKELTTELDLLLQYLPELATTSSAALTTLTDINTGFTTVNAVFDTVSVILEVIRSIQAFTQTLVTADGFQKLVDDLFSGVAIEGNMSFEGAGTCDLLPAVCIVDGFASIEGAIEQIGRVDRSARGLTIRRLSKTDRKPHV